MNVRQNIALRLVLLFLAGSALSFGPSANSVTQKIQNAQSAFEAGDYSHQGEILVGLAEENPWWKSLWEMAGEAFYRAGGYYQAIACYQRASELNSLSDPGRVNLGDAYQKLGDYQAAESVWQGLELLPEALIKLTELYESQGDISAAVEVWEKLLATSDAGEDQEYIFHFALLVAAERPPEALPYLDQSAEKFPVAADISGAIRESLSSEKAYQYVTSGQALAAHDYWELAAYAFEQAAILRPDYMEAYLYWGEALQHIPNPVMDAREILEKGLALDDQAVLANLFLGLYWQRQGSHDRALEYFQVAETAWPEQPDIYIEQGRSLAALGDLESALDKYHKAIELAPLSDTYYRQLADFCVLYSYQVREVGLPSARIAVQLNDQDPANLDSLGQVILALDDQMNAIQFFLKALDVDPGFAPAYYHLGILYSARDDRQLAVYYLQQAIINAKNPALLDQAERLLSSY
jgi:tetratricopeptide (TPR) repeat protein